MEKNTGKSYLDKHQKDVELILWIFSLAAASGRYEKPMKEFLNRTMKEQGHALFSGVRDGRVRLDEIKRRYISRFGSAYKKEFQERLDARNKEYFQEEHRDIQDSYANIITWRNEFAH